MGWDASFMQRMSILNKLLGSMLRERLEVIGYPQPNTVDFLERDFTLKTLSVDDFLRYKLLDKAKAESIIKKAALPLSTQKMMDSGWRNILGFEKVNFLVSKTGTYVTDPSFQPAAVLEE